VYECLTAVFATPLAGVVSTIFPVAHGVLLAELARLEGAYCANWVFYPENALASFLEEGWPLKPPQPSFNLLQFIINLIK